MKSTKEIVQTYKTAERYKTFPFAEWHRKDVFEKLIRDFLLTLGYNPDHINYDDTNGIAELKIREDLKAVVYISSIQEEQRFLSNKISAPIDTIPDPETGKPGYEIAVVTNFEKWFFYFDGREIYAISGEKLEEEYDTIKSLISKDAIESGKFKEVARSLLHKEDNEPLRQELNILRVKIANKILQERTNVQYLKNPDGSYNNEILNEITTRWITRFLALKLAEDSGISFNFTLRDIRRSFELQGKTAKPLASAKVKEETLSNAIRALMNEFERRYNGGIFMYEEGVDYITIPDSTFFDLLDFTTGWAFTIEDARIIGFVYERFLGQEIVIEERKGRLSAVLKNIGEARGRRKAGGIYYTPKYIVDYIVENTLGEILKEKRKGIENAVKNIDCEKFISVLREVKSLKVLDPACGSGSFLIKVFAELKNFYGEVKGKAKEIRREIDGLRRERIKGQMLFIEDKEVLELEEKYSDLQKEINEIKFSGTFALRNNIYGVDLDPKAIDITAFTLMVQVYDELKEGARCPTMIGENLKIGNSLVSAITPDEKEGFISRVKLERFKDEIGEIIRLREIEKSVDVIDELKLRDLIKKDFGDVVDVYLRIKEKYPNAIHTSQQKLLDEWYKRAKKEQLEKTYDILINQTGLARIFLKEVYFEKIGKLKEGIETEINKPLIRYFNSQNKVSKDREFEEILKDREKVKEELRFIKDRAMEISKSQPPKAFNWEIEFPEVFFNDGSLKENPGFDCVVGNPPYFIIQDDLFSKYIRLYFDTCREYSHTAIAFLEKLLFVGTSNLNYGMIVPKSISYVDKWLSIRNKLIENGFKEIADVSDAFVGVNLEQVVIVGERGSTMPIYNSSIFDDGKFKKINSFEKNLSKTWNTYWFIYSTPDEINIFKKIVDRSNLFKNIFLDSFEGLSGIRRSFLPAAKGDIPILIGRDIDKYYSLEPSYAIKKNLILNSDGKPKSNKISYLLKANKIIAQNILTKITEPAERVLIKATIDENGIFVFNTVQVIFLPNDCLYSLKFLIGLLNSVLISWFATYFLYNKAKLTMHFDREYAGKIPICSVSSNQQVLLISLVSVIIQKKKEYHAISQNLEDYLEFKDCRVIRLDDFVKNAIDDFSIVSSIKVKNDNFDVLRVKIDGENAVIEYGMKRKIEEYEIDEDEEQEIKGKYIIEWHEAGNGKIKDSSAVEFLAKVLKDTKNFSKAKQKSIWQKIAEVKVPEFSQKVKEGFLRYKSAMKKAKELDEEITKIDRAIDRLVYDLYGLTEEERKVVEKSVWGDRFEERYKKLPSRESVLKLAEEIKNEQ
ncbi:N-6 DNA methylase [Dehalococcoidia bacterium]|nr:N-6 DNA methylase [Dehalococcoidia bacterium]